MVTNTTSRRRFLVGIAGAGLGAFLRAPVCASHEDASDKEGFVRLFNGKSLQGWHTNVRKTFGERGNFNDRSAVR